MCNEEWRYLHDLLQNGYPYLEALQLLGKDTTRIREQLELGHSIEEILITQGTGRFFEHLSFFLKITSLSRAIDSSLQLYDFERNLLSRLLKKTAYPLSIFVFAYVMLLVFSTAIIPQMLQSFDQGEDFQGLLLGVSLLQGGCRLIGVCALCLLAGALHLRNKPAIRNALILRSTRLCKLASHVESYLFAGYMVELLKQGIPTRTALQYLEQIRKGSLFCELHKHLMNGLQNGEDILCVIEREVLLNDIFKQSFRIGSSTGSLCSMLQTGLQQQERTWERLLKRTAVTVQCIAYSFVGVVVLLVYQIMLIPLTMLEQM